MINDFIYFYTMGFTYRYVRESSSFQPPLFTNVKNMYPLYIMSFEISSRHGDMQLQSIFQYVKFLNVLFYKLFHKIYSKYLKMA